MFLILLGRGRHQDASKYIDDGARMPLSLPVTARPRHVKVVVYDYGADLLNTATVTNIR